MQSVPRGQRVFAAASMAARSSFTFETSTCTPLPMSARISASSRRTAWSSFTISARWKPESSTCTAGGSDARAALRVLAGGAPASARLANGEPPFENVGEASRLFYGAQLGREAEAATRFFRAAAANAGIEQTGALPADILVLLLWRLGRPAEALHAALERPADDGMPSLVQATGMVPSLLELARAGDALDVLRAACRNRGDEITFAATYVTG